MTTQEERQWELMRQALLAESQGKRMKLSSKRTLFGIPSSLDQAVDALAAEENERCQRILRQKRNNRKQED